MVNLSTERTSMCGFSLNPPPPPPGSPTFSHSLLLLLSSRGRSVAIGKQWQTVTFYGASIARRWDLSSPATTWNFWLSCRRAMKMLPSIGDSATTKWKNSTRGGRVRGYSRVEKKKTLLPCTTECSTRFRLWSSERLSKKSERRKFTRTSEQQR